MNYHDLRALLVKRFNLPQERVARNALRHFTIAERAVFYFFAGFFIFSGTILFWRVSNVFLVDVPLHGGTLTEGVVGNPRFLNPVLALSQADKDVSALVYSGLLRLSPNGLVNDLADNLTVSPDGLVYTAHLRSDALFHDGTPITADDILFTVGKIQDPNIKSPYEGDWAGVEVAKVDDTTVTFTLKKAYTPFKGNLTLGILPKHIWSSVTSDEFSFSQFNSLPIGSGPYQISTVERDSGGIPNYYDLKSFDKAVGGEPYITHIIFKFYSSENDLLGAYNNGDIQGLSGISPDEAHTFIAGGAHVDSSSLPRIFAVFFNQTQSAVLHDETVREALNLSAPKEEIVDKVLLGQATIIDSALPPAIFPWTLDSATTSPIALRVAEAEALLAKAGWTKNPQTGILEKKSKSATITLSFSISTSDTPELKNAAELLKDYWGKIGAKVEVLVFDPGDLNQNVIRPRHYDSLLFGEVVGRDVDVYPFWHSSERNDPGLNIALYANSKVDKLLEDLRSTPDQAKREADYKAFDLELRKDIPAVFLYTPSFLYAIPENVQAVNLNGLAAPEDRFMSVSKWFIETNSVWQIFVK